MLKKLLENIIVLELYTLLTFPAFYKIFILGFDKYIIGDHGDGWHFIWGLWWVCNKVILENNISRLFYSDYSYYPHTTSLVFHTLSPLNGFIGCPLAFLFNFNYIPVYNILVLISFPLTGYFGYLLAGLFLQDKKLRFLYGFFITFSSYHVSKALGYFNFLKMEFLILFFYFFFSYVKKRSRKYIFLSAFSLFLLGLSELHYLYFSYLTIFLYSLIYVISIFLKTKKLDLNYIRDILIIVILSIILFFPWVYILLEEYQKGYADASWNLLRLFKIENLFSFFLISPFSLGWHLNTEFFSYLFHILNKPPWYVEAHGIGLLSIFLFVFLLYFSWKNKGYIPGDIIFLFFTFWIISTNFLNIISIFPFNNLFGTTLRFISISVIFFYLIIIILLENLTKKLKKMIVLILILDYLVFIYPLFYSLKSSYYNSFFTLLVPDIIHIIRNLEENFSIMPIPLDGTGEVVRIMYLQTIFDKPLIASHLSRAEYLKEIDKLRERIFSFLKLGNCESVYEIFRNLKIKYIVVDKLSRNYEYYKEFLECDKIKEIDESTSFIVLEYKQ